MKWVNLCNVLIAVSGIAEWVTVFIVGLLIELWMKRTALSPPSRTSAWRMLLFFPQ